MRSPSRTTFQAFFKEMPAWALPLILVLLFGRFVYLALWKLLS